MFDKVLNTPLWPYKISFCFTLFRYKVMLFSLDTLWIFQSCAQRKMYPYSELFWSMFFLHFPAFGLNKEKIQTRITRNTNTFYSVALNFLPGLQKEMRNWNLRFNIFKDFVFIKSILSLYFALFMEFESKKASAFECLGH